MPMDLDITFDGEPKDAVWRDVYRLTVNHGITVQEAVYWLVREHKLVHLRLSEDRNYEMDKATLAELGIEITEDVHKQLSYDHMMGHWNQGIARMDILVRRYKLLPVVPGAPCR